jgi:alanyl-tRNA synthetase
LVKALEVVLEERTALQKKVEALENEKIQQLKIVLLGKVSSKGDYNLLIEQIEVPNADALKQLAYELRDKVENLVAVFATEFNGKPQLAVFIAENLVKEKSLNAGQIVKDLAKEIRGGGGGQPFFATAGGSDASGLGKAIEKAKSLFI